MLQVIYLIMLFLRWQMVELSTERNCGDQQVIIPKAHTSQYWQILGAPLKDYNYWKILQECEEGLCPINFLYFNSSMTICISINKIHFFSKYHLTLVEVNILLHSLL